MSPLEGRRDAVAAGVASHSEHSFAKMHLRAEHGSHRIGLRGHGSPSNPHKRCFRFSSPNACSGRRWAPGATTAVPRSPRSASALDSNLTSQSEAGSDVGSVLGRSDHWRAHRGLSPGKVVEAYRTKNQAKLAWPILSPGSGASSPLASPRGVSPRGQPLAAAGRMRGDHGNLEGYGGDGTGGYSGGYDGDADGPLSPRAAARHVQQQQEQILSTADAVALAAAACAEAEAHAEHWGEEAVFLRKPPSSPRRASPPRGVVACTLFGDDMSTTSSVAAPWRVGITQRTSEQGASRLFPCHLVTPHCLVSAAAAVASRDGREGAMPAAGDRGTRENAFGVVAAGSAVGNRNAGSKPSKALASGDASPKTGGIVIGFGRGTSTWKDSTSPRRETSPRRARSPPRQDVAQPARVEATLHRAEATLSRSVGSSALDTAGTVSAPPRRTRGSAYGDVPPAEGEGGSEQRVDVVSGGGGTGGVGGGAAQRLSLLKGKLERTLRSAEDNHTEMQQAEVSLMQRRSIGMTNFHA